MLDNPPYWPDEIEITLRKWSDAKTVVDPDYDEPVGDPQFESTTYKIPGLVDTTNRAWQRMLMGHGGDNPQTTIRIIFREQDLKDLNIAVIKKDKIVRIGEEVVDLQVIESRPESVMEGDFLLRVLECEDLSQAHVTA